MELRRWLRFGLAGAMLLRGLAGAWPGSEVRRAHGYEFEVRARTIGQGYSLRSLRLLGPSLRLDRRRFTQVLSLSIFDIGELRGPRRGRHLFERAYPDGPHVYFSAYLRLDHDDGSWATGQVRLDNQLWDAVDLIPELQDELLDLDVLYAYAAAEGIAGGWLDLEVGRQLRVATLDWWSMDGVAARVHAPRDIDVEVFGGLRVRESSLVATGTTEPDGTGGAECAEYVEGAVPGSGAWRPIDRESPAENRGFDNDFDVCPQRDELMPTFGGAIEGTYDGPVTVWARAGYRRSMSRRPGLIGAADRFAYEDTGYYPNERGQAPRWGTNEERVAASVRATLGFAGQRGQVAPYAAGRYDVLTGSVDEAHAGVRLRYGAHAIEPEVYHSTPRFDGDSIFNVFALHPYTDVRLTYDVRPASLPVSGFARAWARRYRPVDDDAVDDLAGGVQVGAAYRRGKVLEARLDVFHEGGYGGRRTGGYGAVGWQATRDAGLRGRAVVVDVHEDGPGLRNPEVFVLRDTTLALQAGASYRFNAGVMFHVMVEQSLSRFDRDQLRLIGVLDLAFLPEVP